MAMDAQAVERAEGGRVASDQGGCELYAFSGPLAGVAARLYQLPADLVARPLYLLLVEGEARAEIHVFERGSAGSRTGTVTTWQGASLEGLPGLVLGLVMAGRDGTAPREEVLSAVRSDRALKSLGEVLCPATPRAAFGHALRLYDQQSTIHATVLAL
ncbi:MAG TPA: hypothetical protein VFA46_07770 [Actinomycetes bacterium]|jgi:hypothetical protein|nr:hypothetical protein [Actinomycetes bacterium]